VSRDLVHGIRKLIFLRYKAGIFGKIFKRRKNVDAVKGIDLKAYPGQILCLLGPNGRYQYNPMDTSLTNVPIKAVENPQH
jgi:hypothetical protein